MNAIELFDIYEGNGYSCDWCAFGYDPCKWNLDGRGERPINLRKCDPETNRLSKTESCEDFDPCSQIFVHNDPYMITDNQWKICRQVEADTKIYKKDLPSSVDTNWQDCTDFIDAINNGIENAFPGVTNFSLKNMWYYSHNIGLE